MEAAIFDLIRMSAYLNELLPFYSVNRILDDLEFYFYDFSFPSSLIFEP